MKVFFNTITTTAKTITTSTQTINRSVKIYFNVRLYDSLSITCYDKCIRLNNIFLLFCYLCFFKHLTFLIFLFLWIYTKDIPSRISLWTLKRTHLATFPSMFNQSSCLKKARQFENLFIARDFQICWPCSNLFVPWEEIGADKIANYNYTYLWRL